MVTVVVFLHPHESTCYTVFFIIDVIVRVVFHVVANAVFVTVFVTVLVTMVAVITVAATALFCDVFDVITLGILEVVLSCFKLVRTVGSVGGEAADSCSVHGEC